MGKISINLNYSTGGYAVNCEADDEAERIIMLTVLAEHVSDINDMPFEKTLEFMKVARIIKEGR